MRTRSPLQINGNASFNEIKLFYMSGLLDKNNVIAIQLKKKNSSARMYALTCTKRNGMWNVNTNNSNQIKTIEFHGLCINFELGKMDFS